MKSTRFRRFARGVGFLTLAVVLWLCAVAFRIVSFGDDDRARPSDCAIVLGAAAYGSKPSPVFAERINHAVALYQSGKVKRLLFTGGSVIDADQSESAVARVHAMAAGVPPEAILTESKSRTTEQNLQQAKNVMKKHGLKTAVIVSDPLHLKRAASMASDLGIDAVTSPTPTTRYRTWKVKAGFLIREVFYLHGYWFTGK
ncbi:YdcF family protein [Luteolibacter flavescens]|uniref:YdcF family protein n=1 Tax=Luteolibacter flavescens TaxID=1859460 RepID=A0ABT3FJR6_9BACT|nr:YdcF family protein [Luteolibacter flavescens]MCW1883775.1 YdcF family protein [Luteolibacter flavescens]